MKRILFLLIALVFSTQFAWANLKIDIAFVNKKGIDKGLVLVNELHSTEEFLGLKPVTLAMKDNLRLEVYAHLVTDYGLYGPSSLVWVYAKIYGPTGLLLKDFSKSPMLIPLGKTNHFVFEREDVGQSIEVSLSPSFI